MIMLFYGMEAMMISSYGGGGDVSFMMIRFLMMMNVIRLTLGSTKKIVFF